MSNLKDTDIDDLFRRASDKYPLRTDNADWDKMAAALDKDPAPAGFDGMGADDKRRKRRFFWLLLLFPLGGSGYYAWLHTGNGSSHPTIAAVAAPGNRQGAGDHETTSQKAGHADHTADHTVAGDLVVQAAGTDGPVRTGSKGSGSTSPSAVGSRSSVPGDRTARGGTPSNPAGRRIGTDGKSPAGPGTGASANGKMLAGGVAAGNRLTDGAEERTMETNGAADHGSFIAAQPLSLKWAGDMQRTRIADDYRLSVEVTAPKSATPVHLNKPKTSYLYAGIIAAPDISTVKMQSVKGVGATFGVLVGYAFNPRWSIETGAYLDRKNYYTDGEYFKHNLNPYGQLMTVDGTCYMWEIPLNVRYTFEPDAKMKWFVTAGFSTYLMSQENYNYAYERSNGWTGHGSWNNTKPSQYPFSIVNLSGGFEQSLGKVGNLRLEPYLRLPLGGIGTGKLPIMSAGVNIGITHRLW